MLPKHVVKMLQVGLSSIFLLYNDTLLHVHNHVNLIAISNHHHHHNSDLRYLQLSTTSSVSPFTWTFPQVNP